MKKVWQTIKKGWSYVNGNKTTIGGIAYLLLHGVKLIFPSANPEAYNLAQDALALWLVGSIAHKGAKTEAGKRLIETIKNTSKK